MKPILAVSACATLAMAFLLVLGAGWLHTTSQRSRLLRLWPEAAGADPALVELASAQARPVFVAHCASCHGTDMRGDRQRGIPDLTDRDWLYGTGQVSEIEQTILYGIRSGHHRAHNLADMPAYGNARPYWRYDLPTLSAVEIGDVTQYLVSLGAQPGQADAHAAARGMLIYNGKAQCYDCHTSDARGDAYIGAANLTDRIWLNGEGSVASIAVSIAGGRAGICPAWVGRLSATDIRALAVYLHAASHADRVAAAFPGGLSGGMAEAD